MISSVNISSVNRSVPSIGQLSHPLARMDPLTAKRSEESRQLALAATEADHRKKVEVAVLAFAAMTDQVRPSTSSSLGHAQQAYSEF